MVRAPWRLRTIRYPEYPAAPDAGLVLALTNNVPVHLYWALISLVTFLGAPHDLVRMLIVPFVILTVVQKTVVDPTMTRLLLRTVVVTPDGLKVRIGTEVRPEELVRVETGRDEVILETAEGEEIPVKVADPQGLAATLRELWGVEAVGVEDPVVEEGRPRPEMEGIAFLVYREGVTTVEDLRSERRKASAAILGGAVTAGLTTAILVDPYLGTAAFLLLTIPIYPIAHLLFSHVTVERGRLIVVRDYGIFRVRDAISLDAIEGWKPVELGSRPSILRLKVGEGYLPVVVADPRGLAEYLFAGG